MKRHGARVIGPTPSVAREAAMQLATAKTWAARGWSVFPGIAFTTSDGRGVKAPACPNGERDATRELRGLEALWSARLGTGKRINAVQAVIPRGWCVIDAESTVFRGRSGVEQLAALEARLGDLPSALKVRTGSGGLHVYLPLPAGVDGSVLGARLDSKVEVLTAARHQKVMLPGSVHPCGDRYELVAGDTMQVAVDAPGIDPVPAAWVAEMRRVAGWDFTHGDCPAEFVAVDPARFRDPYSADREPSPVRISSPAPQPMELGRPASWFNRVDTEPWAEKLAAAGWVEVASGTKWRAPDDEHGQYTATLRGDSLTVWSPKVADRLGLRHGQSSSRFDWEVASRFGGDRHAAVREIGAQMKAAHGEAVDRDAGQVRTRTRR